MAATLRISQSQQLRFYQRTPNYANTVNIDNVSYPDFFILSGIKDLNYVPYCQKVEKTDSLIVQFRTTYPAIDLNLVNASTFVKTSYNSELGTPIYSYLDETSTTVNVYNVTIDVTGLEDSHYFEIIGNSVNFPYVVFWSEKFDVQTEHEETTLIKFGGNTSIADGMRWGDASYTIDNYQYLRIEAKIIEQMHGIDANNYEDSDSDLTPLNNYPKRTDVLQFKELPFYINEKIKLGLAHDEFYVDEVLYNTEEDYEPTIFKNNLKVTGSIPMRKRDYENYSSDPILTGDVPTVEEKAIYAAAGKALFGATGKAIGQY